MMNVHPGKASLVESLGNIWYKKNLTALLIVWYRELLHVQNNHLVLCIIPMPLFFFI